jgi:monoamine oxidase
VVVGGGWAGFGAAWQLIKLGFEVQLLDGAPNPGGLASGWRTKEGRAVEAGIKGFWCAPCSNFNHPYYVPHHYFRPPIGFSPQHQHRLRHREHCRLCRI